MDDPDGACEPFPSLVRVTIVEGRYHQVTTRGRLRGRGRGRASMYHACTEPCTGHAYAMRIPCMYHAYTTQVKKMLGACGGAVAALHRESIGTQKGPHDHPATHHSRRPHA